jgi:outer membrane protein
MQRSAFFTIFRQVAALFLAAVIIPATWAQETSSPPNAPSSQAPRTATSSQPFDVKVHANPVSPFPNPIAPYKPRNLAPPNLANTARIDQLLRDGKLYLSMNDTVALALENNLDIAISRYNLNIADTDIWRADAGNAIRGVNTGVLQGTPGGQGGAGVGATSTGGGAGGTTTGIGGVGTGTAGQVLSTTGVGAPIPQFDPTFTSTLQLDQNRLQSSSPFSNPFTNTHTATWDFAYQQGFHWGTNLTVAFNNTRNAVDSTLQAYSPQYNSNFRAAITQPLLAGFGFLPNTRFIKIAKNNRAISDFAFRLQVISTVNQVQNIYWDLVNAYESAKVQQESLALAEKTLSDNKKQVEIGTLAPIEVVRAQSVVATNQQSLIVAQTSLQLQQLLIKNAVSRTLVDPVLADAEVIPTDTMSVPEKEPAAPTEELVKQALTQREELAELRLDLRNREIGIRSAKNNLLPALNLFAYYQGSGLGGSQNANYACLIDPTNPICATVRPTPNISYGGTLNQLIDSTAPDKGIGLQLNIPIRNRSAQSDQVRAELEYRQAQISMQQGENRVRIEVRNAQFSVQQNRAAVEAAKAAVELGKQSLDAEQKKYSLGASTTTLVLGAQRDLTQSESNLVSAMSAYEKSRVELDRSIGVTLDRVGIIMNDAERGQVTKAPNVPYVAPRPPEQQTPVQPQMQQQQPQQ